MIIMPSSGDIVLLYEAGTGRADKAETTRMMGPQFALTEEDSLMEKRRDDHFN